MFPQFLIFILCKAVVVIAENDSVEASYIDFSSEENREFSAQNRRRALAEAEARKVKKNESEAFTESHIYLIDKILKEGKENRNEEPVKNSPYKRYIQGNVKKKDATLEIKSGKIQDQSLEKVEEQEDTDTKNKISQLIDDALRNDFKNQMLSTEHKKKKEIVSNENQDTKNAEDLKLQGKANFEEKYAKYEQDQENNTEDILVERNVDHRQSQKEKVQEFQVNADDEARNKEYEQDQVKTNENLSREKSFQDQVPNIEDQKSKVNADVEEKGAKYEQDQEKEPEGLLKEKNVDGNLQFTREKDLRYEQDQVKHSQDLLKVKNLDSQSQNTKDQKLQENTVDKVKDLKDEQDLEKKIKDLSEEKSVDKYLRDNFKNQTSNRKTQKKVVAYENKDSTILNEQKLRVAEYVKEKYPNNEQHQEKKVDDLKEKSVDNESLKDIYNGSFKQKSTNDTDSTRKNTQTSEYETKFSPDDVKLNDSEKEFNKEVLSVEINITDKADTLRSKDDNQIPVKVIYDDSILHNMEQVRRLGSDSEEVLQSTYLQDKYRRGVELTEGEKAEEKVATNSNVKKGFRADLTSGKPKAVETNLQVVGAEYNDEKSDTFFIKSPGISQINKNYEIEKERPVSVESIVKSLHENSQIVRDVNKTYGISDILSDQIKSNPGDIKTEQRKFELADSLLNQDTEHDRKDVQEKIHLHESDYSKGLTMETSKIFFSTQEAKDNKQDLEFSLKPAMKIESYSEDNNNMTVTSSVTNTPPFEKVTLVTSTANGAFGEIVNDSTQLSNETVKDKNLAYYKTDETLILNKGGTSQDYRFDVPVTKIIKSEEETNSSDNSMKKTIKENETSHATKEEDGISNIDYLKTTTQITPLTTAFTQQQDNEANKELSYAMESVKIKVTKGNFKVLETTSSYDELSKDEANSDDGDADYGQKDRKKEYVVFELFTGQNYFKEEKLPTKKNPRLYPMLPKYYETDSTHAIKPKKDLTSEVEKSKYVLVHNYDPKYAYYNPRDRYEYESKVGSSQIEKPNDVIVHNYDPKYAVFNPKNVHFDDKRIFDTTLDDDGDKENNYANAYNENDHKSNEILSNIILYYFPNHSHNLLRERTNKCHISYNSHAKRSNKDCFNEKEVYQETDSEQAKEKVPPNSNEYEHVYNALLNKIPPLTHGKQIDSILSTFGHGGYVMKHTYKKSTTTPSPNKQKSNKQKSVYEILFGPFENADEEIEKSFSENNDNEENREKKKGSLESESQEKKNPQKKKKKMKKKKYVRTSQSTTPKFTYKGFHLYPKFIEDESIKNKLYRLRTENFFNTIDSNINRNRFDEGNELINAPKIPINGKARNDYNKIDTRVNNNRFDQEQKNDPSVILTGSARNKEDEKYIKTENHQTFKNFYINQNLFAETSFEVNKNKQTYTGDYYHDDIEFEFPQRIEKNKISKDIYGAFDIDDDSTSVEAKPMKLKRVNTLKHLPKKTLNNPKNQKILIVLLKNLFQKANSYKTNKKQPLKEVKRNNKELDTYLNVLKDMINQEDNEALKNFDWLRTAVDIRLAVNKLRYLSNRLKNNDINSKDLQLFKYILFLYSKTSAPKIQSNLYRRRFKIVRKEEDINNKSKNMRYEKPLEKSKDFKVVIEDGEQKRAWLTKNEMIAQISEFEKILRSLESGLDDLHIAIKNIAKTTTYHSQNWYKNLRKFYLKEPTRKKLLEVLLHLTMTGFLNIIEESFQEGLQENFYRFIREKPKLVEQTIEEFQLLVDILQELRN